MHKQPLSNQKGIAAGLLIISIALAGIGLAFVGAAQHTASLPKFATQWTETKAVVTEAGLAGEEKHREPFVKYTYEVEGKSFEGERIFFSEGPFESLSETENGIRLVAAVPDKETLTLEYGKGDTVTVYYNPRQPREAVLNPYVLKEMKTFFFVGIAAVVAAMVLGVTSLLYE